MMYQKALLFNDHTIAQEILAETSPYQQKALGRKVRNYVEKDWADVRVEVMVLGLYAKFTQHEDLKKLLLDTGNTIIAEASPTDKIWGIGLGELDPRVNDKKYWPGLNLLGITLMRVRDIINQESGNVFQKNLEMGTVGEDTVYSWLKDTNSLVQDMRYQKHGKASGPRLEGTEGRVILPDFAVWNKNPAKGNFLVDVKVKSSVYPVNGKRCFTVDSKFEDYVRCVEIMKLDYLQIIFIYDNRLYVYKDSDCCGTTRFDNQFSTGDIYLFEYDKSKIKY